MAVNINVPSQVKTYANLAAFPATGALKTIYIAEDTNKTYRWTGSVYTEISASAAMTWGAIGGTLSNQTDLQSALDAKVPTSRTLTINGVTQDLSADRTFTISTGITIGSTAIASGVVGRVLFQGTGNVVQQSSSLFWDNTNVRLGVGTSSPTNALDIVGAATGGNPTRLAITNSGASGLADLFLFNDTGRYLGVQNFGSTATGTFAGINNANLSKLVTNNAFVIGTQNTNPLVFAVGASVSTGEVARFSTNSNFLIGTTTDAGFRLDVNGTIRASLGQLLVGGGHYLEGLATSSTDATLRFRRTADNGWVRFTLGASSQFFMSGETGTGELRVGAASGHFLTLYSGGSERIRLFNSTGNIGINTTTDAGFRLDVNGTARVKGTGTSISTFALNVENSAGTETFRVFDNGLVRVLGGAIVMNGSNGSFTAGFIGTAGQIGAGTTSVSASAQLEISSTTRGFLPPRMTTTQKNAIASPAAGLMVYDTTLNVISYYNGTMWI